MLERISIALNSGHLTKPLSVLDFKMITKFIPKIFRARSARYLEDLQRYIPKIRDSEEYWLTRGEEKMRSQMAEWRRELEGAPEKDVAHRLRAIRLNVLGLVCAAATQLCGRANADDSMDNWDMRPYDVQLLGGLTLQDRQVAEIATGEGKTLVATLPACLFALAGRGVHIVTANDYLATRDAEWMATLYNRIGLSVGAIFNGQGGAERRDAYQRNITYGTAFFTHINN